MTGTHSETIDAARLASDALLASDLNPSQQQLVLDLMNATQDLNTLYWEQVYANKHTGGLIQQDLTRLAFEAGPCDKETAERIASHIVASTRKEAEFMPLVREYAEGQYQRFQNALEEVQRGIMSRDEFEEKI